VKINLRLRIVCIVFLTAFCGASAGAADNAGTLFAANQFSRAKSAYLLEIKRDPERVEARIGLLRTLLRLDQWQDAMREAQQWVAVVPRDGDAHGLLSLCLMRQGEPAAAETEAKRALELNPACYWGLVAHGRVGIWNHELSAAQTDLHRAIGLHPDWPEAWYWLLEAAADDVTEATLADSLAYLHLAPKGHPNTEMMETLPTRIGFVKRFLNDIPYREVSPVTEERLDAADRGEAPVSVFTTPLERKDNYMLLPLKVGDQSFHVLFDTGGGFELTLTKSAIARLNLPVLFKSLVRGVSGSEPARLYEADEMTVGQQAFHSIPVMGIDSEVGPFDGIFGVTNFDHYAVTMDFTHNSLTLARGRDAVAPAPAPGNRLVTTPFHYVGGDILVPVTVEGRPTWAVVDTGADAFTLISLRLAREIAASRHKGAAREVQLHGRIGIGNSATRQTVDVFKEPVTLSVGTTDSKPYQTTIDPAFGASPLDEQVSPAADFEVGALLGIGFLSTAGRVTFDYPHRILTLEFPPSAPARSSK
jgi:Tfp pilus assembly protein PilF